MLARIAHELYWIGRQLARAEHTSRMLDGVFHADLQGRPDDPAGVRLSWDALLTIVSGEPPEHSATRDQVLCALTLDPEHPTSVLNCVTRARRMNFAIRYLTEYRYESPVTDNLNALRVKPATMATQSVEDFVVRVEPESRLNQHLDYFGTTVIEFGISRPHEHLAIDVRARVRTSAPPEPPESSWAEVEARAYDEAAGESLLPSGPEPDDVTLDDLVGLTRADTPLATLRRLVEVIPDRFEYRAGVTYVGSTIQDLLDAGAGVCQDFAHLGLLLLRRHGIGARYVSGYLWAPAEDDASAEVDTHAWIEALLPTSSGLTWVAADPTNRTLGGESHVKIGHGRMYSDVPPIKGVYRGGADSELSASVRMTRGDAPASR
jgi:transglutaminase-like putative cysteine protease